MHSYFQFELPVTISFSFKLIELFFNILTITLPLIYFPKANGGESYLAPSTQVG